MTQSKWLIFYWEINELIKTNFFDMNVLLYTVVVTANEYKGDWKKAPIKTPRHAIPKNG